MDSDSFKRIKSYKFRYSLPVLLTLGCVGVLLYFISNTSGEATHSTDTESQDSLPFLHGVGVNTLISDSGVLRYRIVAEEWDIHAPAGAPSTWKFIKGMLMLRLDEQFNVDLYVQADTAYFHNQEMWELRGRVRVRNLQGTRFNTEELYWDINKHEIWNHAYMKIVTPERTLEGTEFRSNEEMTQYSVMNSKGDFPMTESDEGATALDTTASTSTTNVPLLSSSVAMPSSNTVAVGTKSAPKLVNGRVAGTREQEQEKNKQINLQDKQKRIETIQREFKVIE